jgi:hypothetical protein
MSRLVKAGPRHARELVELIRTTAPYRAAVANNSEGWNSREFVARFLALPHLGERKRRRHGVVGLNVPTRLTSNEQYDR